MVEKPLLILPGAVLTGCLLFFVCAKIYQDRRRSSIHVLWTLLGSGLCLLAWACLIFPRPLHLWQRIAGAACAPYGLLLYYVAIKQMFHGGPHRPFLRSRAFWLTTLFVAGVIGLDLYLGEGAPVYDSTDPGYAPSLLSLVESALGYAAPLSLDVLIVRVYYQSCLRTTQLPDQSRLILSLLAFLINGLALVLVEAGVLLVLYGQVPPHLLFNSIYHVSLLITIFLLACGYILPRRWLFIITQPLASRRARRQEQRRALLRQLHQMMVRIVPSVQLPCQQIHDLRVLIEISDARQVIWSQQQRSRPLSAREEARHLQLLLATNTVLTAPGAYVPAPTRLKDTLRHNILVAKRLYAYKRRGA